MPHLIKTSFYKRAMWPAIKLVMLVMLIIFIYLKLEERRNLAATTLSYIQATLNDNLGGMMLVLLLMPLNWSLEAVKWKMLVKPMSNMSFLNAIKGVLTGLSLSFMTPHGLGDYFGRIMQANNPKRGRYIGAIMLGRICQMIPTLLFGLIGLYYISSGNQLFYIGIAVLFTGTMLFIYLIKRGELLINHISLFHKIRRKVVYYFGIIGLYSPGTVIRVVVISILRYMVFATQFGVVIYLFLPKISLDLNIAGVTWIFLSKSVLPTFNFLSDLGVREFSAIYFFDKYNVDLVAVVSASLSLWLINILVPTIVGAPLTLKMKLKAQ